MRVIVCGSRHWTDRAAISERVCALVLASAPDYPVIVHGAARGADRLAEDEAGKAGLLTEAHPADWERYGKAAGPIRNKEMAALGADLCIAFWDGRSTGTAHMIDLARKHGIPVEVISDQFPQAPRLLRRDGQETATVDARHKTLKSEHSS